MSLVGCNQYLKPFVFTGGFCLSWNLQAFDSGDLMTKSVMWPEPSNTLGMISTLPADTLNMECFERLLWTWIWKWFVADQECCDFN